MTVCQEQFLQLLQSHGTQECRFPWPPEAGDLGVSAGRHHQKSRSPAMNTGAAALHGSSPLGHGASGEAVTAPVAGANRRRSAKGALAEKEKKKEILKRKRKMNKYRCPLSGFRKALGEQEEGPYQPP